MTNAFFFHFAWSRSFKILTMDGQKVKRTYLAIPQQVMKDENYPLWSRIPFSVKFEFFSLWYLYLFFCVQSGRGSLMDSTSSAKHINYTHLPGQDHPRYGDFAFPHDSFCSGPDRRVWT